MTLVYGLTITRSSDKENHGCCSSGKVRRLTAQSVTLLVPSELNSVTVMTVIMMTVFGCAQVSA